VGVVALLIGIVFITRRFFRNRRLGKAEFPPDSPLLFPAALENSLPPHSDSWSISQESERYNRSKNWGSNEKLGSGQEGFGGEYRGTAQLSPLPPVASGGGRRDVTGNGVVSA